MFFFEYRFFDFYAGVGIASLIQQEYSFNSKYSWIWFYVADLSIIILFIFGCLYPCDVYDGFEIDQGCKSGLGYLLLESFFGDVLWLALIYSLFYKPSENKGNQITFIFKNLN